MEPLKQGPLYPFGHFRDKFKPLWKQPGEEDKYHHSEEGNVGGNHDPVYIPAQGSGGQESNTQADPVVIH